MSIVKQGKNACTWKIGGLGKEISHVSPEFQVDGRYCRLNAVSFASKVSYGTTIWGFWLKELDRSTYPFNYTMSIVDHRGQDFFIRKGTVERREFEPQYLLVIHEINLINNKLVEGGDLTLRFTIERVRDPTTVLHCTSQTESLDSPATKDTSTNTGSSSDVLDCATQTEVSHSPATKDTRTNTESEPAKLLETLSNDFSTFYESRFDTDCVLRVDDAQFPVHRSVLSARSPVFSAMFHQDTTENRSGEVNIPKIKATALSDILYYMYSGKIKGLTADSAAAMYAVADKYSLIEIRDECLTFLKHNLTMENISDAALLAHTHGETELEERVVHFIEDSLEELDENEKWTHFTNTKPLIANKLLYAAFKASKKRKIH